MSTEFERFLVAVFFIVLILFCIWYKLCLRSKGGHNQSHIVGGLSGDDSGIHSGSDNGSD